MQTSTKNALTIRVDDLIPFKKFYYLTYRDLYCINIEMME